MTELLSRDETYDALIAKGVPHEKARVAAGFLASPVTVATTETVAAFLLPKLEFPIRLTLPWSALCSDNERERASLTTRNGRPVPTKVMSVRYKLARTKVVAIGRKAMGGFPALAMPLAITARVWVPDERLHDVVNFAKGVNDGLEQVVYTNDKWLHRSLWERAGVDVDAPRAEIEIAPLSAGCR